MFGVLELNSDGFDVDKYILIKFTVNWRIGDLDWYLFLVLFVAMLRLMYLTLALS